MKRSYIELHLIVILLGFTAILGKLSEVSSLTLVFYRTLIAAIALFLILFFKKQNYKIPNLQKLKLLGIGLILGSHWLCFFGSAKTSTVSISLVTFATVSVFTSFLKPFILNQKVERREVIIALVATAAVILIFGFELKYHLGIFLGLLSALFAAIFSMYNAKLTFDFESRVISFYEISGACLTMLIGILFFQPKTGFLLHSQDVLWVAILGLVCTVYPQTQMIALMKKIDIFTVNLSLNLEPIYGIFMAFLIFGESEKMSIQFYIGAAILVGLVFLDAYLKHFRKTKA
jgi:drug/metabolite transporter (DMT)-like permease